MADRIVRDFTSFDYEGNTMLKLISQLHTSRVSAFGFTAEADVLGVETYAINEQLDNKICPVCRAMHGRTFEVPAARRLLDQVLFEDDPDIIKSLQPWPSQKAANVAAMRGMTDAELIAKGWHIPPFHPWCRGLLVHVDSVPDLKPEPLAEGEIDNRTRLGREVVSSDFDNMDPSSAEFLLEVRGREQEMVDAWNLIFGDLNPKALYNSLDNGFRGMLGDNGARLILRGGRSTDGLGGRPLFASVDFDLSIPDKTGLEMASMQRTFYRRADEYWVEHDYFKIRPDFQNMGLGKSYMANAYTLYQEMGLGKVKLHANINVGAYAWAKYGFVPSSSASAQGLMGQLKNRLNHFKVAEYGPKLGDQIEAYVVELIEEIDQTRSNLQLIADLGQITEGKTLGYWLLEDLDWYGELDMYDPGTLERFLSYVGGV